MPVKVEDRDLGWKAIKRELKKLNNSYVDVGLFGQGQGPDQNIAERGAVHELGSSKKKIPSRPWMRMTFKKELKETQRFIEKQYNSILARRLRVRKALKRIGVFYEGKLRETMTRGPFIPLKAATIKARKHGGTRPLIDTEQMRKSITSKEVVK